VLSFTALLGVLFQLIGALCQAEELHKPLRRFDKRYLNETLSQGRFPLKFKVTTAAHKCYVLLQAAIDQIPPADFFTKVEQCEIVERTIRILGAVIDNSIHNLHGKLLESSLLFVRALRTRLWESSKCLLSQCHGVSEHLSKKLSELRFSSVADFRKYTPAGVQNMVGCSLNDAKGIVKFMQRCMRTALTVATSFDNGKGAKKVTFKVEPVFSEGPDVERASMLPSDSNTAGPDYALVSYDILGGLLVCFRRICSSKGKQSFTLPVPTSISVENIRTVLLSDIVGLDFVDGSSPQESSSSNNPQAETTGKRKTAPTAEQRTIAAYLQPVAKKSNTATDARGTSQKTAENIARHSPQEVDENIPPENTVASAVKPIRKSSLLVPEVRPEPVLLLKKPSVTAARNTSNPFSKFGYPDDELREAPTAKYQSKLWADPLTKGLGWNRGRLNEWLLARDKAKELKFELPFEIETDCAPQQHGDDEQGDNELDATYSATRVFNENPAIRFRADESFLESPDAEEGYAHFSLNDTDSLACSPSPSCTDAVVHPHQNMPSFFARNCFDNGFEVNASCRAKEQFQDQEAAVAARLVKLEADLAAANAKIEQLSSSRSVSLAHGFEEKFAQPTNYDTMDSVLPDQMQVPVTSRLHNLGDTPYDLRAISNSDERNIGRHTVRNLRSSPFPVGSQNQFQFQEDRNGPLSIEAWSKCSDESRRQRGSIALFTAKYDPISPQRTKLQSDDRAFGNVRIHDSFEDAGFF
jgi:hypothetical protein